MLRGRFTVLVAKIRISRLRSVPLSRRPKYLRLPRPDNLLKLPR